MDRINKQLLTDFLNSQEIILGKESEDFEIFCNYTVLSNEYNKTLDLVIRSDIHPLNAFVIRSLKVDWAHPAVG